MRAPYQRSDGRVLKPNDWIEIDRGVGRFSGTWENPTLGTMASLAFFRAFDRLDDVDTLWLTLPDGADILERAFKVSGPLKRSGKRPRRVAELRVVGGTAA